MQSRRTRFLVVGFSMVAVAATGVFLWDIQQRDRALTTSRRDVLSRLEAMSATVSEIAAAQDAYLATPDELDADSQARVTMLVEEIQADAEALSPLTRSPGSADGLRTVLDAASALVRVDERVREGLAASRSQATTDLILEAQDIIDSMLGELRNLRFAESAAFEAAEAEGFSEMWLVSGMAALVWLAGVFLLMRAPQPTPQASPAPPVQDVLAAVEAAPAPVPPVELPPVFPLEETAAVCTALARANTPGDVERALGEAANVLRAKGIVIWLPTDADETDGALAVAAASGYGESELRRLGTIHRDADNATAAVWRSGAPRMVPAEGKETGGVVVPLLDNERCFGVLAAELVAGQQPSPSSTAAATIFAAQFASVLWTARQERDDLHAVADHREASGM